MSDRLPDNEGRYLVYAPSMDTDKPFYQVGFWDGYWIGIPKVWADAITHWMVLEAPKDE